MSDTILNVELRQKIGEVFTNLLHPVTSAANVIGLLGEDEKLISSIIPSYLFGGMRKMGTITAAQTTAQLYTTLDAWATTNGGVPLDGYLIATGGRVITISTGDEIYDEEGGDTPKTSGTVTMEPGDWIVLNKVNEAGTIRTFGIVNNTYRDASTTVPGIVQLNDTVNSTSIVQAATANAVKTTYDFAATKVTANADIVAGTKPKITYDVKGLVTAGADLLAADIPDISGTYALTSHDHPVSEIDDSTTVGQNLVTLANPSAITFLRVNANNTVDALSAANFRIAISASEDTHDHDDDYDKYTSWTLKAGASEDAIGSGTKYENVGTGLVGLARATITGGFKHTFDVPVASTAEAKAGTSDIKAMTPLKTLDSIQYHGNVITVFADLATANAAQADYAVGSMVAVLVS